MPAANGGEDGATLLSLSQPAMGPPARLADPSVFQPLDFLGLIPNQPVNLGPPAASIAQPRDLFPQVARDLGMPGETFSSGQVKAGIRQIPLVGNMQNATHIDPIIEYRMKRQGVFIAEDHSQQLNTFS